MERREGKIGLVKKGQGKRRGIKKKKAANL